MITERKTAGELSHKANADTTKYDALEVGHALADEIEPHLRQCIENHKDIILEDEFCIVMVLAKDPLIHNVMRRKFYAWPYLPSPRPNQSVFLYNKRLDKITKRLWVLPSDMVMAELSIMGYVDKRYQTMQAWSIAFFKGTFWEYIRYDQKIDMLSESEYLKAHREELVKAGCQVPQSRITEAFDFSKIHIKNIIDTQNAVVNQDSFNSLGKA